MKRRAKLLSKRRNLIAFFLVYFQAPSFREIGPIKKKYQDIPFGPKMGPNSSCDASGVIVFSSYLVHNMLDLNNKNEFIAEIVVVFLIPFLPLASTNFDKKIASQ